MTTASKGTVPCGETHTTNSFHGQQIRLREQHLSPRFPAGPLIQFGHRSTKRGAGCLLVEDDGHAAGAIRFAQLEHGEGGAGVGFAPGRDAVVAGDIRQVVFGNEERHHVEDGLKLRLRVNLPELALAGFLAAFAAVAVRGGDSGAGREAGLAEFLQTNPNFPRNTMGDFLQYLCERCNFAKTQSL
jgi:hypothetical protein